MIINGICAIEDCIFTAGSDGIVKKWMDVDKEPTLVEEIDTGKCINLIVAGHDDFIFVGDTDGYVKRLQFGDEDIAE